MKKLSKVEIARRIRDNRYKIECPYPDDYDGMCGIGGCEYYDFCIQANDEQVAIFNKEAVDNYIKRYSRKPDIKESLTTEESFKNCEHYTEDCCLGDDSCDYKDCPHYGKPLPEPVPIAEIIGNIETEKTYWALTETCGKEIVEVSLSDGISDVTAEKFEDSRGQDIPWDSIYRTISDAIKIAESRGWK